MRGNMHGRKIVSKNPGRYKMFANAFPIGTDTFGITKDGRTIAIMDMTWDDFWDFYYEVAQMHREMEKEKDDTSNINRTADECETAAEEEQSA